MREEIIILMINMLMPVSGIVLHNLEPYWYIIIILILILIIINMLKPAPMIHTSKSLIGAPSTAALGPIS
jgi:hypothetical protein